MFYVFLLVLGLVVGSFIGMLSYRLPRGVSILGRSFCDSCLKSFPWYQNIPVLYYLTKGGKCGMCKKHISLRYPLIEGLTALTFVATGFLWLTARGDFSSMLKDTLGPASLAFLLLLTTCYLSLVIIDLEHTILPDFPVVLSPS